MARRQQTEARQRWERNRRVRRLKRASKKTFEGCSTLAPCYGVPFPPGDKTDSELTERELVEFERILARYLP